MNLTFHCSFGQYISDFIQEKHTLGFPYIESGRVLRCFDKFCTDNFPAEPTLSAEIGNAWAVIKPTEKSVSFQNRLGPVRKLAKYMNRMGKTAYVIPPELSPKTDPPYQPHIFTEEELKAFFHEADSYPVNPRSRIRHLQIVVDDIQSAVCDNDAVAGAEPLLHIPREIQFLLDQHDRVFAYIPYGIAVLPWRYLRSAPGLPARSGSIVRYSVLLPRFLRHSASILL